LEQIVPSAQSSVAHEAVNAIATIGNAQGIIPTPHARRAAKSRLLATIPQNVEIVARVLHAEGATVYLTYDWVPGHTPNGEDTWKLLKRVIGATSGAYATLSACHDDIYLQSRAMLLEMESAPFAVDCIYAEDDSVAMTLLYPRVAQPEG
jgi:hypothetical protein